jgi:maltose O-acetyltransferase
MRSLIRFIINKIRGNADVEVLKKQGLNVGKNLTLQWGTMIDPSHCWLITIGDDVTLAARVYILAHDASTKRRLGYTKIGLVSIGNNTFIGANTTILPNVKIGNNVIIGAGSVVTKDIPDNVVAVGNPARVVAQTDAYVEKNKLAIKNRPIYDESYTLRGAISNEKKQKMIDDLKDGIGYVE